MEGILLGSADGRGRTRTREGGRSRMMCSMDGSFGGNGFDGSWLKVGSKRLRE